MRRWKVLIAIGFVVALAVGSVWIARLVRQSDTALARWASIANIIGLPLAVLALLLGIVGLLVQRSASQPREKVNVSAAISGADQIIFGDIPQEPKAFDKRIKLFKKLTKPSSNLQVDIIVGRRGVGKSQLAGVVARKRIAQRWRVVAWLNAENEAHLLAQFSQIAINLRLNRDHASNRELAASVRHWLESDGERCLLVLDNAVSASVIRRYLPAGGKTQVIVTTDNHELTSLGISVPVTEFTADQAITYMQSRTGLTSMIDIDGVVADLNYLPLALAQAASVVAEQRLDYTTYRQRLKALRVSDYLTVTEADPYPRGTAEAIMLSVSAAEAHQAGSCRPILELLAVFSQSGVPRSILYSVAEFMQPVESPKASQSPAVCGADVDASLQLLTRFSLVTWDLRGDSISLPGLIARVILERADRENTLRATAKHATGFIMDTLQRAYEETDKAGDPSLDPLMTQGFACVQNLTSFQGSLSEPTKEALLRLRMFKLSRDSGYALGYACALAESGLFDDAAEILEQALVALDSAPLKGEVTLPLRRAAEKAHDLAVHLSGSGLEELDDVAYKISEVTALVLGKINREASSATLAEARSEIQANLEKYRRKAEVNSSRRINSKWRYRRRGRRSADSGSAAAP